MAAARSRGAAPRARVSVALCTYNGARHIAEQLGSILAQSRLPDEVVVSDDGSSDDTLALVRAATAGDAARGVTVRVLTAGDSAVGESHERGVTANFARAISACSGDIVILCDQDDRWHPTRVAEAVAAFDRDPALLFRHENARLVDETGQPLGTTLYEALGITGADRRAIAAGGAFDVYLRRNLATGATVSFRRSLYDIAAPLPLEWVHDEWLAIVAAAVGVTGGADRPVADASTAGVSAVEASTATNVDYRQHSTNVIGVAAPTLRYRIERMLATPSDRTAILAARSRVLANRLASLDGVGPGPRAAARAKAEFESRRAVLPPSPVARALGILRLARTGGYTRFASQGRLDMVRDALQRPGRRPR